jgi:hypothetical protein
LIVDRALLIACRQTPELLTPIDEPLDPVAETVKRSIEWAGAMFVPLVWDGDSDPMLARIRPNLPAAVAFVTHNPMGPALGAAWPWALDGAAFEPLFEDHRLMPLSGREHEGHQLATPFSPQMDFRTEPAAAPAEGFGRWVPFFAPAAC